MANLLIYGSFLISFIASFYPSSSFVLLNFILYFLYVFIELVKLKLNLSSFNFWYFVYIFLYFLVGCSYSSNFEFTKNQLSILPSLFLVVLSIKFNFRNAFIGILVFLLLFTITLFLLGLPIIPQYSPVFFLIASIFFAHSANRRVTIKDVGIQMLPLAAVLIWFPEGRSLLFWSLSFLLLLIYRFLNFNRLSAINRVLTFLIIIISVGFVSTNLHSEFLISRTLLYFDVLRHLNLRDSYIFGTTQGVGYYTDWLDMDIVYNGEVLLNEVDEILSTYGRFASESMLLNAMHWRGLVGVFFFIFITLYNYRKTIFFIHYNYLLYVVLFATLMTDLSEAYFLSTMSFWYLIKFEDHG